MKHTIINLKDYPQDGNHQECLTQMPIKITKGQDGFTYTDKNGERKTYNLFKDENKIDDRWICYLDTYWSNSGLADVFVTKVSKDLDKILAHCVKMYKKGLKLDLKRIKEELKQLEDENRRIIQ